MGEQLGSNDTRRRKKITKKTMMQGLQPTSLTPYTPEKRTSVPAKRGPFQKELSLPTTISQGTC